MDFWHNSLYRVYVFIFHKFTICYPFDHFVREVGTSFRPVILTVHVRVLKLIPTPPLEVFAVSTKVTDLRPLPVYLFCLSVNITL